jgi:hypothetical protein
MEPDSVPQDEMRQSLVMYIHRDKVIGGMQTVFATFKASMNDLGFWVYGVNGDAVTVRHRRSGSGDSKGTIDLKVTQLDLVRSHEDLECFLRVLSIQKLISG